MHVLLAEERLTYETPTPWNWGAPSSLPHFQDERSARNRGMTSGRSFDMRKYQNLTLIVLTVVSVTGLLYFKHQYDKVRNVLEVLEFFGEPSSPSVASVEIRSHEPVIGGATGSRGWSRVSDDVFVFSSYLLSPAVGKKQRVIVLAMVRREATTTTDVIVWCTLRSRLRTLGKARMKVGRVPAFEESHRKGRAEKGADFITLTTEWNHVETPDWILLTGANRSTAAEVRLPVVKPERLPTESSVAVCLLPPLSPLLLPNAVQLLEFLVFYKNMAVTVLHSYGSVSDDPLGKQTLELAAAKGLKVEEYFWNPPFPIQSVASVHLLRDFIILDCSLRSRGETQAVFLASSTSEFLVPKTALSLKSLLKNEAMQEESLMFQEEIFCIDDSTKDDSFSDGAQLRPPFAFINVTRAVTVPDQGSSRISFIRIDVVERILEKPAVTQRVKAIPPEVAALHVYKPCVIEYELKQHAHSGMLEAEDSSMNHLRSVLLRDDFLTAAMKILYG